MDPEALARRAQEAFLARDVEAFASLLTDDAELRPALAGLLEGRTFSGSASVAEFFANFDDSWDDVALTLDEIEVSGDRVLALGRFRATGHGSAVAFDEESGSVSVIRDGRIASWRGYLSHAQAREEFERGRADTDALVRRYFDAFNRRDVDGIVAMSTDDIEVVPPAVAVDEARYVGSDGATAFFAALDRLWSAFTCEPSEILIEGDQVFATGMAHTIGRFDGVTVDADFNVVFALRDGKICRLEGFLTRERALTVFQNSGRSES